MTITQQVREQLQKLPEGYVFTYKKFLKDFNNTEAIIKALNRFVSKGEIQKIARGKYYKPKKSAFGILKPSQEEIVKDLLIKNNKVIGYLTGYSIYNTYGLNTQMSNTIEIACNDIRPKLKRGDYTIKFIRQKNEITKKNIPLLQLLDMLRYIKKIPDTTPKKSISRLISIITNLGITDLKQLVKLSQKYTPATRALLGAMLCEIEQYPFAESLKSTLNPISYYQIGEVSSVLTHDKEWNIL